MWDANVFVYVAFLASFWERLRYECIYVPSPNATKYSEYIELIDTL